jgi:hypothetical protein
LCTDFSAATRKDLKLHKASHHPDDLREVCDLCGANFLGHKVSVANLPKFRPPNAKVADLKKVSGRT